MRKVSPVYPNLAICKVQKELDLVDLTEWWSLNLEFWAIHEANEEGFKGYGVYVFDGENDNFISILSPIDFNWDNGNLL